MYELHCVTVTISRMDDVMTDFYIIQIQSQLRDELKVLTFVDSPQLHQKNSDQLEIRMKFRGNVPRDRVVQGWCPRIQQRILPCRSNNIPELTAMLRDSLMTWLLTSLTCSLELVLQVLSHVSHIYIHSIHLPHRLGYTHVTSSAQGG